jgi:hypothetical protein
VVGSDSIWKMSVKMVPPGKMTEEEYQAKIEAADKIVSGGGVLTQAQQPPDLVQLLAPRYSDAAQSQLKAAVKTGQGNDFRFELTK